MAKTPDWLSEAWRTVKERGCPWFGPDAGMQSPFSDFHLLSSRIEKKAVHESPLCRSIQFKSEEISEPTLDAASSPKTESQMFRMWRCVKT